MVSGAAEFDGDEREEVDRVTSDEPLGAAARNAGQDAAEHLRQLILDRLAGWRHHAAHPLATSERREACELVAADYERMFVELQQR